MLMLKSFLVPKARIHFQIPGLLARGMLQSHGAYVKAHGDETTSIPLVIFSVSPFPLNPAISSY